VSARQEAERLAASALNMLSEARSFNVGPDPSERLLADMFEKAIAESGEAKDLRRYVEMLKMDRQMYADIYEQRTQAAKLEGFEAGQHLGQVNLDHAKKRIAGMAALIRLQADALGCPVEMPLDPCDMRPATVKP
jgi:flagellar biosynthesis/type III secretory pathway protein FliH